VGGHHVEDIIGGVTDTAHVRTALHLEPDRPGDCGDGGWVVTGDDLQRDSLLAEVAQSLGGIIPDALREHHQRGRHDGHVPHFGGEPVDPCEEHHPSCLGGVRGDSREKLVSG